MIAYHGSPHFFDAFDLSAIGSGEGCQSFGHGFYLTGSPSVARWYSGRDGVAGATVPVFYILNGARTLPGTPEQKAADLVYGVGVLRARVLAAEMLAEAREGDGLERKGEAYFRRIVELTNSINSSRAVVRSTGHIYEAIIPESESMLHWNLKVSDQPDGVREALAHLPARVFYTENMDGESIYKRLAQRKLQRECRIPGYTPDGDNEAIASDLLCHYGIRGIQYRCAHEGCSNYVIFAPEDVQLLSRDGIPIHRDSETLGLNQGAKPLLAL